MEHLWPIRKESDKIVENPLPKWAYLAYSWVDLKNSKLFERYDQVFEDEILRIPVMAFFPKWTIIADFTTYGWSRFYGLPYPSTDS